MNWLLLVGLLVVVALVFLFRTLLKTLTMILLVLLLLFVGYVALFSEQREGIGVVGGVHEHANLLVVLDGQVLNLSQEKYTSAEGRVLSNFIHLHDGDGGVMHKHASRATLEYLFDGMGMAFNETCFVTDEKTAYCTTTEKKLVLYVDGLENSQYQHYEPRDLDRILIVYGDGAEEEIQTLLAWVSDDACIYSERCPERGKPPEEASCIGSDCAAEGADHD